MVKKILVAVDGSESNKVAVDKAVEYAKQFGADLTAICVFDIGSFGYVSPSVPRIEDESIKQVFDYALDYVRARASDEGVPLTLKTVSGRPSDAIIDASSGFDLVVCGTLGRTGLSRALMGSVAETVVRMAHCPVLVVRSQ